ncbi:MAG: hypothetical protein IH905_16365 [Proteobacteria bacterium]|nr:hypothetical protein [Pseudomonadota bacterium]
MRKFFVVILSVILIAGCVAPRAGEPSHPAQAFGQVLGYLVVSPVLILVGLLEGISSAPYYIEGDLHAMNAEMVAADSDVTLDQTYQYAYNRRLETVPRSGDTGKVFRHLGEATPYFQNVLKGYGVPDYDRYIITAVRTADREGYTLYGLVYRPTRRIRVRDDSGRVRTLGPRDRLYYRPHEIDADGAPLDSVIDWAGVPRTTIRTQKGQAILMTLGANAVLINRRSDDYWAAERRWIDGYHKEIATERKTYLDQRMGKST